MEKILKIGIVTFLILFSTTPALTVAEQADNDDVEVYIKGGLGVTIGVINNGNTSVEVRYNITDRTGTRQGNMTVPPNPEIGFEIGDSTARFSLVSVKVSWNNETRIMAGFTLLFFTYLRRGST